MEELPSQHAGQKGQSCANQIGQGRLPVEQRGGKNRPDDARQTARALRRAERGALFLRRGEDGDQTENGGPGEA